MSSLLEKLVAKTWNGFASRKKRQPGAAGVDLGLRVVDERTTNQRVTIPHGKRAEHLAILGKTGQGKSKLLHHLAKQDIEQNRGFVFFDLHGDTTPFLLGRVAEQEQKTGQDLSQKLIVVEPADRDYSIGLNVLERQPGQDAHVQLSEFAAILRARWRLESFGARTEELLRNSLHVISDNQMTLLELPPLLTSAAFRTAALRSVDNPEITGYFRSRFDRQSEAMQAVYRDAILNKISGFTTDPRFRHILGQQRSTFSLLEALDRGHWVIFNLDKGRLGEQATTLGSLLVTKLKNALFARRSRRVVTLYCDEIQNIVALDAGMEVLLAESRKFGVSIVAENQFLEQYPPLMRAAIAAVGTHIYFQLSSHDAEKVASALDGSRKLSETLKNLPKRHLAVKSGHQRLELAVVPNVPEPQADYQDLYRRCRERFARRRTDVEAEIRLRQRLANVQPEEALNDWE